MEATYPEGTIGFPLLEIFSVSVDLAEQNCASLSCTVDADGNLDASGIGLDKRTSYSQQGQSSESINPEHNDDVKLELYGTVKVRDGLGLRHFLYNKDSRNPECVYPKDTISLTGPSYKCLVALGAEVFIDIMDKNRGQVSKGWFVYNVNQSGAISYLSKRLSSVVHGDHGCAIVHYMIIPRVPKEVYVVAKLYTVGDKISSAFLVFGSIVVEYGGHDYSTEYQKKYFRTALFRQAMHGAVQLNGNSADLPLSQSLIVAPMDTSIIIDADLYEKNGETKIPLVNKRVEFPYQENGTASREFLGENVRMVVNVDWRDW